MTRCKRFYQRVVIGSPRLVLLVMALVGLFFALQTPRFFMDASSDSLMLENDPALIEFRKIDARYGKADSLIAVTFTPHDGELFTPAAQERLRSLRDELKKTDGVTDVLTLLDVPLFQNPPVPLAQVVENVRTLEDPNADLQQAKQELLTSDAYQQELISTDGETALIAVYLSMNLDLERMRDQRQELRLAMDRGGDDEAQARAAYDALTPALRTLQKDTNESIHKSLVDLRRRLEPFRADATIRIGGALMVGDDLLSYISSDLRVFGVAIFMCIILILSWFFRRARWVITAVICCAYSTVVMVGLLGLMEWPVTVISSNFISLLLIMNMSLVIHLVVQYRELSDEDPAADVQDLLLRTVERKWIPALFTTLTTIAGFSSLLLCDIKPVKDFGLMMSLALLVALIVSFVLFPALLMLFKKERTAAAVQVERTVIQWTATWTEHHGRVIVACTLVLIGLIVFGTSRLTVENSFVNYFRKSSDIYQGMVFIDEKLGGTTPLDVVITLPGAASAESVDLSAPDVAVVDDSAEFDEFAAFDEFDDLGHAEHSARYWYTESKLETIRKAHQILDRQDEVGKVWSLATLLHVTDGLNGGTPLDAFELAIMIRKLPDYARTMLVDPYVSVEDNQFRVTARIYDSMPTLRRAEFLKRIEAELNAELDLPEGAVVVSGMMVLYNSVLQSLFHSQILTLGVVFLVLMIMFLVLFRSLRLALIAIFPNLISAMMVLGILGLLNIPLDIMTITIASISIGIAVDNTIHYMYRCRKEYNQCGDYILAMHRTHQGVGIAMFYTSLTIIAGFMLLVFSSFVPSILFGLLCSVAMLIALLGALTLLPLMLISFKPFGKKSPTNDT
jgi:predicted RND superfamily exporter protein